MKRVSPAAAWSLVLAALLLLGGCVKTEYKALDTDGFQKKISYLNPTTEVYEGAQAGIPPAEKAVRRVDFRSDEKGWRGMFLEFSSASDAVQSFDALFDEYGEGTYRDPGGDQRSFEYVEKRSTPLHWYVSCVDNTILTIAYPDGDAAAKSSAGKLKTAAGY